jgi:4-carboxymuconolactone decarboxylase
VALCVNPRTLFFIELAFAEQISVIKVKEIILQNYLFCGFPNVIEALIVLNRVLHDNKLVDEDYDERRNAEEILKDGLDLCRQIYGKNYTKLIQNMNHLSSDLSQWMIMEGYGKVLSRPILSPRERELAVIAALAVMRRERQLISHIRGAVHVGSNRNEIIEICNGLSLISDHTTVEAALKAVDATLN